MGKNKAGRITSEENETQPSKQLERKVTENSGLGSASTQGEGLQKSRENKLTCDTSEKEEMGEHEEREAAWAARKGLRQSTHISTAPPRDEHPSPDSSVETHYMKENSSINNNTLAYSFPPPDAPLPFLKFIKVMLVTDNFKGHLPHLLPLVNRVIHATLHPWRFCM